MFQNLKKLAIGALFLGAVQPIQALTTAENNILNFALTLEYLEAAFYNAALAKFNSAAVQAAGYSSSVYQTLQTIAADEAAHVSFIQTALGSSAVSNCTYAIDAALSSVPVMIATAQQLEAVGVKAYAGVTTLASVNIIQPAASIMAIEARHASYLNKIAKMRITEGPFDTPVGLRSIYSTAAGLINLPCAALTSFATTAYVALGLTTTTTVTSASVITVKPASALTGATNCLVAFGNQSVAVAYTAKADGTGTCTLPVTTGYTTVVVWVANSATVYAAGADTQGGAQSNILAGPLFVPVSDNFNFIGGADTSAAGVKTISGLALATALAVSSFLAYVI